MFKTLYEEIRVFVNSVISETLVIGEIVRCFHICYRMKTKGELSWDTGCRSAKLYIDEGMKNAKVYIRWVGYHR